MASSKDSDLFGPRLGAGKVSAAPPSNALGAGLRLPPKVKVRQRIAFEWISNGFRIVFYVFFMFPRGICVGKSGCWLPGTSSSKCMAQGHSLLSGQSFGMGLQMLAAGARKLAAPGFRCFGWRIEGSGLVEALLSSLCGLERRV